MAELSPVTLLSLQHNTDQFRCGESDLDHWLKSKAVIAQVAGTARTYVLTIENRVVCYYALTLGRVERRELPRSMRKDMPAHPIPLVLLARLAVDQSLQGKGAGRALVRDAFLRGLEVAKIAGGVGLFVEVKNEQLERFYENLGFLKSPSLGGRLFLPYPKN